MTLIQKPGKPQKHNESLRPITFLNTRMKKSPITLLKILTLNIDKFLSQTEY